MAIIKIYQAEGVAILVTHIFSLNSDNILLQQSNIFEKHLEKNMKVLVVALIIFALLGSVESLGLREHEDSVSHTETLENHEQYQEALVAVASQAAKKLIQNPYEAAQIPTKYVQGYIDGLKSTFEGAWNIQDRTRSLQLTFVNLATEDVVIEDTYFDSGTWYQTWLPEIKGGMVVQGTVANSQGSWFTGVTGGMRLSIRGTGIYIYVAFNNPYSGSYKNYGELSYDWHPASYAYDNSQNNYPKNTYLGGYRFQVVQTTSPIAQMAFIYELSKA